MIRDVEEVAEKTYQRLVVGDFADSRETWESLYHKEEFYVKDSTTERVF